MLLQENVRYKPSQAYTVPATGTNSVPTVCQAGRGGGGGRGFEEGKQHGDKRVKQTSGLKQERKEGPRDTIGGLKESADQTRY